MAGHRIRWPAMADKLKLHRCSWTFLHTEKDACWKVQKALDEMAARVRSGSLRAA